METHFSVELDEAEKDDQHLIDQQKDYNQYYHQQDQYAEQEDQFDPLHGQYDHDYDEEVFKNNADYNDFIDDNLTNDDQNETANTDTTTEQR